MKKVLLLLAISASMFIVSCKDEPKEPTPTTKDKLDVGEVSKENTSLVVKFSGTNCPPCGSWGWSFMTDLITGTEGKANCLTAYGQNFVAKLFIMPEATTLQDAWKATGYPHFGANGSVTTVPRSGSVNTAAEKAEIFARVDAHKAAVVKANTGVKYEIVDGKLKLKYKVKAFEEMSGDNHLAIYLLEHEVVGYQAGHADGNNSKHKHILRKEISGQGYGKSIGAIASGKEVSGDFEMAIPADWNTEKLEVVTALYVKSGTAYTFTNSSRGVLVK
jgi:hypothetical protein